MKGNAVAWAAIAMSAAALVGSRQFTTPVPAAQDEVDEPFDAAQPRFRCACVLRPAQGRHQIESSPSAVTMNPLPCPVRAMEERLRRTRIASGAVFRRISTGAGPPLPAPRPPLRCRRRGET